MQNIWNSSMWEIFLFLMGENLRGKTSNLRDISDSLPFSKEWAHRQDRGWLWNQGPIWRLEGCKTGSTSPPGDGLGSLCFGEGYESLPCVPMVNTPVNNCFLRSEFPWCRKYPRPLSRVSQNPVFYSQHTDTRAQNMSP